jgi:hypothetical protein
MARILTLALVFFAVATAPAGAAIPRDWLGVTADGPLIEAADEHAGEWPLIAASGATSVRIAFRWHAGQPLGPGAVDFGGYDAPVLAAARQGLGVLPVVFSTPLWARRHPANEASPPRDPVDYASFITALVHRYGPRGSLWTEHPEVRARPIRAWQLWNEPNLPGYWSQQPFAKGYVRLLKVARAALRAADPRALAVLAGLPNGWDALRRIYRAGGRRYFDAVAIHPYTARADRVPRYVLAARRVMHRFGDRRKPVWVTEMSWPAARGRAEDPIGIATDDRGQARRLRRGLTALAAARRRLRVRRVYWYTWLSAESSASVFAWSGLRRIHEGAVVSTPALAAFRAMARRLRR